MPSRKWSQRLPELERLDVRWNHIGDAGFEAFSEAMAPVASKSKLRFINVRDQNGNLGNLGVQALGKTLALLPALEEVVISWNENITDEGLVGPFVPLPEQKLAQPSEDGYGLDEGVRRRSRSSCGAYGEAPS